MLTKNHTVEDGGSRGFTRISLALAGVGAILLGAGLYGAWQVSQLQRRGDNMLSQNVASIRAAEELETIVREFQYRLKRFLATREPRHIEQLAQGIAEGQRWLAEAEELAKSAREQQLVSRMQRGYQRFRDDIADVGHEELGDEDVVAEINNLAEEVIPNKILVYLQKYVEHNEEELSRNSERNQQNARQLMYGLLLLGSCGGAAGLLAGYLIARSVSHTIVQLSLPIRDTAGKLNEVVGPVTISTQPGFDDLQAVLLTVSQRVSTVVERLQEQEREVLRAEQLAAVGQLAAGMAHELRNPLTAAKAVLQLADEPGDLSERDLHVLRQEVWRLERSVQTFLDFARPPQPEKSRVDVDRLIHQIVDLVGRRAQLQRIRLKSRTTLGELQVSADTTQLRQVLLNLLLNALDAVSLDGTVMITAEEETCENGNQAGSALRFVVIRVSDTGPGLPSGLEERIFAPFVSTKETGLGLGLSICRRIVEAHGGTITAADSPSGGSVFTVRIPREAATVNPTPGLPADERPAKDEFINN